MKPTRSTTGMKPASIYFAILLLLIFAPLANINAQLQSSTLTIAGWSSGTTPVFSGTERNVINLKYGDTLSTNLAFSGQPDDGLETDHDNAAFMSFSYSYTVYLTPYGSTFPPTASIPIGTHTISAFQSCSSSNVPPWTIGYDNAPAMDTDYVNMDIPDMISECVAAGDYQVDILIDNYSQNSVGPNAEAIQLGWYGYADNYIDTGLAAIYAPSEDNVGQTSLIPANDYLLSQVAFIHIDQLTKCPPVTVTLPRLIETIAPEVSVTAQASYAGQCPQSTLSYLWSTGETTATATLREGIYTVTATSQCGTTAAAAVIVSSAIDPGRVAMTTNTVGQGANNNGAAKSGQNNVYKKATDNTTDESADVNPSIYPYPNPAKNSITFDLGAKQISSYTIRIMDIAGNEAMQPIVTSYSKTSVTTDALPAGIYLYEIAADQTYRGKFIKE